MVSNETLLRINFIKYLMKLDVDENTNTVSIIQIKDLILKISKEIPVSERKEYIKMRGR